MQLVQMDSLLSYVLISICILFLFSLVVIGNVIRLRRKLLQSRKKAFGSLENSPYKGKEADKYCWVQKNFLHKFALEFDYQTKSCGIYCDSIEEAVCIAVHCLEQRPGRLAIYTTKLDEFKLEGPDKFIAGLLSKIGVFNKDLDILRILISSIDLSQTASVSINPFIVSKAVIAGIAKKLRSVFVLTERASNSETLSLIDHLNQASKRTNSSFVFFGIEASDFPLAGLGKELAKRTSGNIFLVDSNYSSCYFSDLAEQVYTTVIPHADFIGYNALHVSFPSLDNRLPKTEQEIAIFMGAIGLDGCNLEFELLGDYNKELRDLSKKMQALGVTLYSRNQGDFIREHPVYRKVASLPRPAKQFLVGLTMVPISLSHSACKSYWRLSNLDHNLVSTLLHSRLLTASTSKDYCNLTLEYWIDNEISKTAGQHCITMSSKHHDVSSFLRKELTFAHESNESEYKKTIQGFLEHIKTNIHHDFCIMDPRFSDVSRQLARETLYHRFWKDGDIGYFVPSLVQKVALQLAMDED